MPKTRTSWKSGQTGNPRGRPKGKTPFEELKDAIKIVEKERRTKLYQHFVNTAFEDNTVLVALMRKLAPDMKQIDSSVEFPPGHTFGVITLPSKKREGEPVDYDNESDTDNSGGG